MRIPPRARGSRENPWSGRAIFGLEIVDQLAGSGGVELRGAFDEGVMFFHLEPDEALEFLEYADRIARPGLDQLVADNGDFLPSILPSVKLA